MSVCPPSLRLSTRQKQARPQTPTPTHFTIFENARLNVPNNIPNNQCCFSSKEAHKFTCTGMTHKGPLFLGGTPLQRRLGFRIRPRSSDVIFQISEPPSLYLYHINHEKTFLLLGLQYRIIERVGRYRTKGKSHRSLFPSVSIIHPLRKSSGGCMY